MGRDSVECDVNEEDVENDNGRMVSGVRVTCTKCDKEVTSCGVTPRSVRRCLAIMREDCPNDEENFYTASNGEDED